MSVSRILALAWALCCTAGWAQAPVSIGMVVEMTGAYAEYGPEAMRGATLALEEINRAGGVLGLPLEIVTEDNESTNPGSVVAVSQLLANRDVKAVITANGDGLHGYTIVRNRGEDTVLVKRVSYSAK